MGSPLRVATYNRLSMLQAGWQDDVLVQFRSLDLLAVVGTCCTTDLQVAQSQIGKKILHRHGRGDRSAGIDLYINAWRLGNGAFRSVESLSGPNKGRALALHIKTRIYDIMFCAFYLPPGERKRDSDAIIEWVSEQVDKCGHRCLPLLCCCDADAHVRFFLCQVRLPHAFAQYLLQSDDTTQHVTITKVRPSDSLLNDISWFSRTPFSGTHQLLMASQETLALTTYCVLVLLYLITSCKVWRNAGDALQIMQTNQSRDHRYVVLTIRARLAYEEAPCEQ